MGSQEVRHYDLLSIGSGEAGKYIAWTLASKGWNCAVVEREYYGGSCPNVACLPSKNVIHSAKIASLASAQRQLFGSSAKGDDPVNMQVVKKRKDEMIDGLMNLHRSMFDKTGVTLVSGEGRFVGPKKVEVTSSDGRTEIIEADKIVLCTGSKAAIPNIPGLKEASPLTHVEILNTTDLPKHLVILGGGYVGLEFAQAMKRLGSQVTVIERSSRTLKSEDEDVVACVQGVLEAEGVIFSTSTIVDEVSGTSGDSVTIKCSSKDGGPFSITGTHILCATGRTPNTDVNASAADIELTKSRHFAVDEHNRTAAEGVFAVGDCAGSPHFTHIGFDDFRIIRDVLTSKSGDGPRRSTRQVPFTLFTDPEMAHVGLREHEAAATGIKYRLTKAPMMAFLRTRTLSEKTGFAKALIAEDETIIGFTAVGPGAGELLPVVQLAMKKKLPYTDLAELVITHPTLSEGLVSLFGGVPPRTESK